MIRRLESTAVYFPTRDIFSQPTGAFEDVRFISRDGTDLHGWYLPASRPDAPVALFVHGNAGNITHRVAKLDAFAEWGFTVFIFDYRGYGQSEGKPDDEGLYADTRAAYDWLLAKGVRPDGIVLYGESIGAAFALRLASEAAVRAVVTENALPSLRAMARVHYSIPGFLVRDRLNSLRVAARVKAPKIFFHSKNDEIVPLELGRRLFDAAAEPKRFVELRGDHNRAFFDSIEIIAAEMRGINE